MKKLLAILLALALCAATFGCAQTPATTTTAATTKAATTAAATTTAAAATTAAGQKTVVKIGILAPLSGAVASQGKEMKAGVTAALEYFNKSVGFKNLKNVQIELVFADSESNPDTGVANFERLVTVDKVNAVLGSYQSAVTNPCATLANKYHIPYVTINAVADTILSQNANYVFRPHLGDSAEEFQHLDMIKALAKISPIKKMAFVGSADDYGNSCLAMYKWIASEIGAEMVISEQFQSGVADMSGAVQKIKAANVDLIIATLQVNEALLFTKQRKEYKLTAPVLAKGGGYLDGTFIPSAGGAADGVLSSAQWLPDSLNFLSAEAKAGAARIAELAGMPANETACNGWLALGIVLDCMDKAQAMDREALATAIDKMEMGPDNWANIFFKHPMIKFEDKTKRDGKTMIYNQNWNAKLQFGQLQNGVYKLVFPFSLAGEIGTAKNPLVWPPKT